jgi:predicted exporter
VIAYLILAITPFPGLKQLAVFAIVGLSMSYATVVCLFPFVLKAQPLKHKPIILKFTDYYLKLWQLIGNKEKNIIYGLLLLISIFGIIQLKVNDDVRQLQSLPLNFTQSEKEIQKLTGSKIGSRFYIVQANTPQKVLEKQHQLTMLIRQEYPKVSMPYLSFSDYLPTITEQQQNYSLVTGQLIHNNLKSYLKKVGMSQQQIQNTEDQLKAIKFKPLTINTWFESQASKPLRFLWIGKVVKLYTGIILLSDGITSNKANFIANQVPQVTFIDPAAQVSQVFSAYRYQISILLIFIYIILLIFLLIRYRLNLGITLYLPPLFSCLITLAMLGYLAIPLTLFNLLALILVLGISTDYVLFFAETRSNYRSTMLATSLSAISTILSFGLLSLSNTAVIHYFGFTVLIGITSAFILAPAVIDHKFRRK